MKYALLLLLSVATLNIFAKTSLILVDADDGGPVSAASVISNDGLILGLTDENGCITVSPEKDFPLIIRSLGYESTTVARLSDTIRLCPAVYSLPEVVVNSTERPIIKILCYVREYCTGATSSDTMMMYSEYMMDAYYAYGKVKGYKKGDKRPSVRNVRRYARFSDSNGLDSVACPSEDDDITILSFAKDFTYVPFDSVGERKSMRLGASTDTVMGKYSPLRLYRKGNNVYSFSVDMLANYEDHKLSPFIFKMLGATMDIDKMQMSYAYNANPSGKYSLNDFIYSTSHFHALAKGKLFKKFFRAKEPMHMDCYVELYPVDVEYLTVGEYKKQRKEKDEADFVEPKNLQPLVPSIRRIVERLKD